MTGGLLLPPALTLCPAAALAAELRTLPTDGGVLRLVHLNPPVLWLNGCVHVMYTIIHWSREMMQAS